MSAENQKPFYYPKFVGSIQIYNTASSTSPSLGDITISPGTDSLHISGFLYSKGKRVVTEDEYTNLLEKIKQLESKINNE